MCRVRDSRASTLTAAAIAALLLGPASQPAGTVPATAAIAGVVVTAAEAADPVRRAVVTLKGAGLGSGRMAVSDDTGAFRFADLPPGRYTLSAAKPGFVTTWFGSRRPGRGPGMPIAIAAGERLDDLSVDLIPGAVIAGRVLDHLGRPQRRAIVSLLVAAPSDGESGYAATTSTETDDLGEFRLWGLSPGRYILAVQPGFSFNGAVVSPSAEIDAALAGLTGLARPAVGPAPPEPDRVGYGPTFFPGAVDLDLAMPIDLEAGDERTGFDVRLQFVRMTRLEGRIAGPAREAPASVSVDVEWPGTRWGLDWKTYVGTSPLAGAVSVRQDGSFLIPALTPGRYVFFARSGALWGRADVDARGQPHQEIAIALQPGMIVEGRIRSTDDGSALPDVSKLPLSLEGRIAGARVEVPASDITPDGQFSFRDVPPGRYRIVAGTLDTDGDRWVAASATFGQLDVLDEPLEILAGVPASGLELALTARPTTLTGLLIDALGRPAPDYHVVIFPDDRRWWTAGNRRIRQARPAQDGTFEFVGVPPGTYLVAAVTDVQPGDLDDPSFLDLLAGSARPVPLGAGEASVLNLQIASARD